jgi:hypothetical protein
MECDACSLVKVYLRSGGTCCLHVLQYAHGKFPRKVGSLLRCCTALHLRRYCLHIHCRESLQRHTIECKQYLTVINGNTY